VAKKKKGGEDEEESSGGAKGMIIKGVVVLAIVGLGLKMFVLKPPPPTPVEIKEAARTEMLHLWEECAHWNHVEFTEEEFEAAFEKEFAIDHPDLTEAPKEGAAEEEHAESLARGGLGLRVRALSAGGAAPAGPAILGIDSITINLAGDNYLKVGIALELADGSDAEASKTQGLGLDVRDRLIRDLSGRNMEELQAAETRDGILHNIGNDFCRARDGVIKTAYYTDFVMQ
jgi:flagellar basal body-associated protein FliL